MVIWRLKLVNVFHLGYAEPSMTKMVNGGVSWGGVGSLDILRLGGTNHHDRSCGSSNISTGTSSS